LEAFDTTQKGEDHRQMLRHVRRIVIKIGSAVLATDTGLDTRIMQQLADQISQVKQAGVECIIVSSGAIAAGIPKAAQGHPPRSIPEKQAAAAVGQPALIHAWEDVFGVKGERVAQILLTRDDLANRARYLNARNTLFTLLHWSIVPIINENDTVMVEEIKFGDNDNLACMMTNLSESQAFINLTHIDGLYDSDPRKNPDSCLISFVPRISKRTIGMTSNEPGAFGRGGMRSKLTAARKVAMAGIPTVIANGKKPEVIPDILNGLPVGTLFAGEPNRMGSRKYWIAFTSKSEGRLVVDDGACWALTHRRKSLLPSGIREVEGQFKVGAKVRVVGPENQEIGVGLVNYPSEEIEKIKGCKTCDIQNRLGYKFYDEVIHRDNLVVDAEGCPEVQG